MTELRPQGETYIVTLGQSWWIRANAHQDLAGHEFGDDVTAVPWASWSDRTVLAGVEIEFRPGDLAAGEFWFGQSAATSSCVFYLAIAETPGAPAIIRGGVELDLKPAGVRQ